MNYIHILLHIKPVASRAAVYLVAAWPLGLGEEVRAALAKKH